MKEIKEYFVPWIKGISMYVSPHIELAWRQPDLHRMMSNENPHTPSEKVQVAIRKYSQIANRYPDQGLVIRGKLAEINSLNGPENVMIGNGSAEIPGSKGWNLPSRSAASTAGPSRAREANRGSAIH